MKAISIERPGHIILKEVPKPSPKKGEALIKIKAVGICGSDVAAYRYKHPNCTYPLIIGHEATGTVEDIPDGYGIKKGDRVILDPYLHCDACYPCSKGHPNSCETLQVLGVQTDGAMSEYAAHPAHLLKKVPDNLSWAQIPLAEPLTISLHAIHRVELQKGEHFTVIGAGAIGIMAAIAAKIYGAVPVILDPDEKRLEMARAAGIEHTINVLKKDAVAKIRTLTNGRMSETIMEASGADTGIAGTVQYATYLGRIALTGWPKGDVTLSTSLITRKELKVYGSRNSAGEFEEALALLSRGDVDSDKIITEILPFEKLPAAVEQLAMNPGAQLKIIGML